MGSGNTKIRSRKEEKIAADVEQVKPCQQQDNKTVNKPSKNHEKNNKMSNNNEPIAHETKGNEEKKSTDSDNEDSQTEQDVKLQLAERGINDPTLLFHCEKTPKYLNYFTAIYEAIKNIEEKLKEEDILSIQRQATVISSNYSKVKRKTILGNFLAEMGFARIFKEIYLKLISGFPELLTYDRELDESLKKASTVDNEPSTKEIKKGDDEVSAGCSEKPKESSNIESVKNLEISSDQTSETTSAITAAKPNEGLTETNMDGISPRNHEAEASDSTNSKVSSAEASSVAAGDNAQSNEQPKRVCAEEANTSCQPTATNNESTNDKPGNSDHIAKVSSPTLAENVITADQPDKPADAEEKKAKPSNPLLKAQDLLSKIMLSAINYTDACDNMNLALSEEGVVQLLVSAVAKLKDCTGQHLKYMNEEGGLKKRTVRGGILTKVLGTLHNLSKRVPTRPNFHVCDAVKIILPLIDDEVNRFAIDALLIIAYLIDEENNNLIMANEGPIKYLISMISKATNKSIHRYLGYTNSELAQGLAQIAINDSNKKQIVTCGAIPVLTHMMEAAKIENEKITAAEALWMLAFDQENREEMKKDEKCMALLHMLKESNNEKTKKAASGALWEIEGKYVTTGSLSDEKPDATITNHVMISYQWDVQKTLIQVKERLQAAGYRVWMDLEQMGGSTLEAMAKAVENSAVVLVCVSQKYKESSNCRSEAEYAFQLKKDIVPLMMDRNYRPDGWLGMIMGSKLWIDFSLPHVSKVESSVKDLMRELGVRGKGDSEIVPVIKSADVVDARPAIDIRGWTKDDVINWMKGFGLIIQNKSAAETLTGGILTRLHTFRNEVSPEFYYSSLKEDFGFPRMIDVLIFSDELKKLLS